MGSRSTPFAEEPPAAHLVAVEGAPGKDLYEIGPEGLCVGRTSECEVRLEGTRVSRRHCLFVWSGGRWRVRDLNSRNGTFVNDTPVAERALEHGDRIRVAASTFLFLAPDPEPDRSDDDAAAADTLVAGAATEELSVEEGHYFDPESLLAPAGGDGDSLSSALVRLAVAVGQLRSLDGLAAVLLPAVLELVPLERATLQVEMPGLEPFAASQDRHGSASCPVVSGTLQERVVEARLALLASGSTPDEALNQAESLGGEGIQTLLAVPLLLEPDRALGLIVLDSGSAVKLGRRQLEVMSAVAGLVAPVLPRLRHLEWLEAEAGSSRGPEIVGQSTALKRVLDAVARVAPTSTTVLIRGESGTGKELIARTLHARSPRSAQPFVAINCASLSETLLESELFGHERGAFTGAVNRKIGKLEVADRGTLFLDEVGELSPGLQARLLRVLESLEFERVGGTRSLRTDVRVLAATNRDLDAAIEAGSFRRDLFHRLSVFDIHLPALRDRGADVALLAHHFLALHCGRLGRASMALSRAVLEALRAYPWPGNVRELSNAVERAAILADGDWLELEHLPEALADLASVDPEAAGPGRFHAAVRKVKRRLVREAVEECSGNLSAAARLLGLSPNYLHRLINNLDLRSEIRLLQRRGEG